ncbi:hypothetical protein [Actinomadura sp. DC4]|uniref:hypothetical protein n=1 Tax=Actinomadura sp. DC4 TaxID=3055069 RepID=UPI0025B25F66|nr:hypothetical protein [Actinomadura sp. DC4]MDN3354387.1 hypothetical protein [Actinomadura sp. DC4]
MNDPRGFAAGLVAGYLALGLLMGGLGAYHAGARSGSTRCGCRPVRVVGADYRVAAGLAVAVAAFGPLLHPRLVVAGT